MGNINNNNDDKNIYYSMRRARFFPLPGGSGRPLTCSVDSQKLSADRSRVCCCCWCVSRVCPCVFVYPKSRIFFFSSRTMACGRRAKPSWRLISGRRYHAHTEGSPYCFFFLESRDLVGAHLPPPMAHPSTKKKNRKKSSGKQFDSLSVPQFTFGSWRATTRSLAPGQGGSFSLFQFQNHSRHSFYI